MKNNVIIIGSRSAGLILGYYLKPEILKIYLGKGFAYEKLQKKCTVILGGNSKEVLRINNIEKGNYESFSNTKDIFIAVRDPDLNVVVKKFENYLEDKNVYVLTSTNSGYNEVKSFLSNSFVFQTILLNGINYLSPSTIHLVGKPKKIHFLAESNYLKKLEVNVNGLFRDNLFHISNKDNLHDGNNNIMFIRYAKTLLSLLCLRYKLNIYDIIETHYLELDNLLNELALLLKTDTSLKNQFISEIIEDNDILGYYTSYYLNKYVRFKIDSEWKYFIKDINALMTSEEEFNNLSKFINMDF
ncbi:MAG: hypothetical protein CO127_10885 [Ignavibacteria bacterium CG_4_9_14_3_um_filter_36_18]|nr:MAG: hypothetical protein CO127_10885 [Ignavibacteria bacterium CG_4_9_14_3_um_filter_36_18]